MSNSSRLFALWAIFFSSAAEIGIQPRRIDKIDKKNLQKAGIYKLYVKTAERNPQKSFYFCTKKLVTMKNIKKSKGFTLVELLIVIAIIGVLASLIYPALSQAMGAGSKVKSMNSASNIAKTWLSYVKTGTKTRIVTGQTIYDWAAALARGVDDFNDPKLWILDFDLPVIEKISSGVAMPKFVIDRKGSSTQIDPEFKSFPISWAVANRTDPNAPSGTPLVWSRGLKPNGEWDANEGVFKREGGHIAYTDAHVEWYTSLRDENTGQGLLTIYGETARTFNIAQAIRGGSANILKSSVGFEE